MKSIALRMDDVGASSKHFEVYSKRWRGLGNFLFLKYLKAFKAWGRYEEMSPIQWRELIDLLVQENACLTVGITAAWVEYDGTLVPFPEKFPTVVPVIKEGIERGVLEIASHGLTHCVLKDHAFRPRAFSSNRTFHREFWDWLPAEVHKEHLRRSKEILEATFGPIITLIPPGNVFSNATLVAAHEQGFQIVNCNTTSRNSHGLKVIGNDQVLAFHDKEIVEEGIQWLATRLKDLKDTKYLFVRDLP